MFAVDASARYDPCRNGGSEPTVSPLDFGILYGDSTALGPEFTFTWCHAAIDPSAVSPASIAITPAGRKYAHVNSSARRQCSETGRLAPFASRAASTAHSPECFPPNPPPKSGTTTR